MRTEGHNDRTTEGQQASQYIPLSLRSLGGYNKIERVRTNVFGERSGAPANLRTVGQQRGLVVGVAAVDQIRADEVVRVVPADVEPEHVQLEPTGHREPGRVRDDVRPLLVQHESFVRQLGGGVAGRGVTRLEEQVAEVVLGRAFDGHLQGDDGAAADRRLDAGLEPLVGDRQTELEEPISHVDAVLELLERDRRLEQLPLRVVGQVCRYEMICVRDEEELVDGVYCFTLIILLASTIHIHPSLSLLQCGP